MQQFFSNIAPIIMFAKSAVRNSKFVPRLTFPSHTRPRSHPVAVQRGLLRGGMPITFRRKLCPRWDWLFRAYVGSGTCGHNAANGYRRLVPTRTSMAVQQLSEQRAAGDTGAVIAAAGGAAS
jgi:hypothetical protein